MDIEFDKNKNCTAYKNLVENIDDRIALKNFTKVFNKNIVDCSIRTYQKLKNAPNASFYNTVSSANNKIEILTGSKNKDNLILKVRLQGDYRKFFHFYEIRDNNEKICITENWKGQFNEVSKIYIYEVNKHDYSKVK